ncbi:hypothetical protein FRB99_006511, partial [Tulasnella sp. 403]
MPPKKRQRRSTEPTSAVPTILHFFSASQSTNSSKPTRKSPPNGSVSNPICIDLDIKGKGRETVSRRELTFSAPRPAEIIAISDDDDDEAALRFSKEYISETRKRTSACGASDALTAGGSHTPPLVGVVRVKEDSNLLYDREMLQSQPSTRQHTQQPFKDCGVSDPPTWPDCSSDYGPVGNASAGPSRPFGLYGPPSTIPGSRRSSSARPSTVTDAQIVDLDALSDNEWLNDDDEVIEILDGEEDDPVEAENIEPPNDSRGGCLGNRTMDEAITSAVCPLCNLSLDDLPEEKVTEHVNACLDTSTAVEPSESDNRFLAPITSFQRHHTPVSHTPKRPDAFALLMSGRKENDAWKAAEEDFAKPGATMGRKAEGRRKAPFYKVGILNEMSLNPAYTPDTTANLIKLMLKVDPKWINPLPFNKPVVLPDTGGVEVVLLEANHCPGSCLFLFTGRQTVNAGDGDFTSPSIGSNRVFRYLHCGDFRASPRHVLHPTIKGKKIDTVYLDTTYLNAKYCFPPQKQVIEACAELAKRIVTKAETTNRVGKWFTPVTKQEATLETPSTSDVLTGAREGPVGDASGEHPAGGGGSESRSIEEQRDAKFVPPQTGRVLVVIGTYSIGKERIVKAVAKALSSPVYCDTRKRAILLCQDDPELHALLTDDPYAAQVHLVPLQTITLEKIEPYYSKFRNGFASVVGFRPTGWTYSAPAGTELLPNIPQLITKTQNKNFTYSSLNQMRNSSAKFKLYGVPYSEHSSFFELTCFALSIDVAKIIATVNVGSAKSRGTMGKWFEKWETERKKRMKDKREAI